MGTLHNLNVGCSDASIIRTQTATFLVDCHHIENFGHLLPSNRKLRGVFITHQHHDHHSGLQYLYDQRFGIDFLVYSPYQRRYGDTSVQLDEWNEFISLRDAFMRKGTGIRDPFRQQSFEKAWWITNGVSFWLLGPFEDIARAETRQLHDACLVITAMLGNRKCVFTGDSSDRSLEKIAANTVHISDDILHASHHGSINGADLSFIKKCNPKYTVISTKVGCYPNIPHSAALQRYADNTRKRVYRTDIDGTLKWTF
jgi:beta-lactamase superfamily II metal-dependent hydrolase